MKAWRFHAFNDMRLDDVPEPVCGPGHVLVEPLCVQPSVTEAQLAQGIPTLAYDRVKRRLETEAPAAALRPRVLRPDRRSRPRRHAASAPATASRRGPSCRAASARSAASERSDLCRTGPVIGFDLPGCFAERRRLPEIALVKVDDRISDSEAACLQSLSDSVAAVETAELRMGDTVAIFGQGSMGLECLQIARLSGAGLIITVDVRDEACQISRELGADHALNAATCDVGRGDPRPDRRQRRRRGLRVRRRQPEAGAGRAPDAAAGDRRGPLRRQDHRRLLVRRPAAS